MTEYIANSFRTKNLARLCRVFQTRCLYSRNIEVLFLAGQGISPEMYQAERQSRPKFLLVGAQTSSQRRNRCINKIKNPSRRVTDEGTNVSIASVVKSNVASWKPRRRVSEGPLDYLLYRINILFGSARMFDKIYDHYTSGLIHTQGKER